MISDSYVFSKFSLNIWKFTVHVLLKTDLENFEHYFVNVEMEANPTPARDAQRAQPYLVCTSTQRPHKDCDGTVFGCLLRRY